MALTPAQKSTLKAAILADPTLNAYPNTSDGNFDLCAQKLNVIAVPDFIVWRSTTSTADIGNAIQWANMTPTDAPDGTATWTNRSLACQGKQFNVQTMITGRDSIPSNRPNVRQGLQDALTNLPSGIGGAAQNAGWTAVRLTMQRQALLGEKILASGTGTQGSPADLSYDGFLNYQDVMDARSS